MSGPEEFVRVEGGGLTLAAVECRRCGRLSFPRTPACTYCGAADEFDERPVGPDATLWGWTVVNAAPPGYDGPVPYGFGVVEIDARIRVVTRIDETDLERLAFGQRGTLVPDELPGDGPRVWTFRPAPPASPEADA